MLLEWHIRYVARTTAALTHRTKHCWQTFNQLFLFFSKSHHHRHLFFQMANDVRMHFTYTHTFDQLVNFSYCG